MTRRFAVPLCTIRPRSRWFSPQPSATTPTSTHHASMQPTSGSCSAARTTPSNPTGSTSRWVTTAGRAPWSSAAPIFADPPVRPCPRTPISRSSAQAVSWISNSRWASSSAPATHLARTSRSTRHPSTSSAWYWSTTGLHGISKPGSMSHWDLSWARTSPPRSHRGSSPWTLSNPSGAPARHRLTRRSSPTSKALTIALTTSISRSSSRAKAWQSPIASPRRICATCTGMSASNSPTTRSTDATHSPVISMVRARSRGRRSTSEAP